MQFSGYSMVSRELSSGIQISNQRTTTCPLIGDKADVPIAMQNVC
jgi:hypothetical protein